MYNILNTKFKRGYLQRMNLNTKLSTDLQYKRKFYVSVPLKFLIAHIFSLIWTGFSVYISMAWIKDFSRIVSLPAALIIITGIAYIPGYLNAFLMISNNGQAT